MDHGQCVADCVTRRTDHSASIPRLEPRTTHAATTPLPLLADADLQAIFRGDPRAMRRYQLLATMLHEGQPRHAAAKQWRTSTVLLGRLRSTFLGTGHLRTLRTWQASTTAARRRVRWGAPEAGPKGWRGNDQRLRGSGRAVVLADKLWPPALAPALLDALPLLADTSPLGLGHSRLVIQLLPYEADPLVRGQWLRPRLRAALDALRPKCVDAPMAPSDYAYQILIREGLRSGARGGLQQELALSPVTYTRVRRQALERLAELLVEQVV